MHSQTTKPTSSAETACSPFFYGQKITHKLNGTAGIITIKGQKYNAGQTWRVRFERCDHFEEVEMWEWEISPENVTSEGSPPSRIEIKQERNGDSLH